MTISSENFAIVRRLLIDRAAIALDEGKAYLVESRLTPLAREVGCRTINELVERIRVTPEDDLLRRVVEAMMTNETSFFRDEVPFETLREVILPDLFRLRATSRRLNIWSAGCAAGQEPFSVAMLLDDQFAEYRDWNVRLIGSDLSTEMLDRARAGRFTSLEVERGLPPRLRQKYFHAVGNHWELDESIRNMVECRQFNLHGDWPSLPAMDVVLMRNVMVYFDLPTRQRVLRNVRQVMRPDGYLLLGGAETPVHVDDQFRALRCDGFSYYQLKQT